MGVGEGRGFIKRVSTDLCLLIKSQVTRLQKEGCQICTQDLKAGEKAIVILLDKVHRHIQIINRFNYLILCFPGFFNFCLNKASLQQYL